MAFLFSSFLSYSSGNSWRTYISVRKSLLWKFTIHGGEDHRLFSVWAWWLSRYAAMNIHVHVFSFLLGIYLRLELLDQMVTLSLTFWGTARLFSKEATPFYIPTSNVHGFIFSTFSLTLVIFRCVCVCVCGGGSDRGSTMVIWSSWDDCVFLFCTSMILN